MGWRIWGFAILAAGLLLAGLMRRSRRESGAPLLGPLETVALAALLLLGLYLRTAALEGGALAPEEKLASVIEVARSRPFSTVFDLWYRVLGFSVLSARGLAATLGLAGLGIYFLALHSSAGLRTALWATALLAVSSWAVHDARQASGRAWILLGLPLLWLVHQQWSRMRSPALAALVGAIAAAGSLAHAGVLLALVALAVGAGLLWGLEIARGGTKPSRADLLVRARALAPALGAFVVVAVAGAALGRPPGSDLLAALEEERSAGWALLSAVRQIFLESRPPLEPPGPPLVENTWWPLVLVGGVAAWKLSPRSRAVILSIPAAILIAGLSGPRSGAGGAAYVLLPLCALAAAGIVEGVDRLRLLWPPASRAASILAPAGWAALIAAVAHPVLHPLLFAGRSADRTIPVAQVLEQLRASEVVLDVEGPRARSRLDMALYRAAQELAVRYGTLEGPSHGVHFLGEEKDAFLAEPAGAALVARLGDAPGIARRRKLCLAGPALHGAGADLSRAVAIKLIPAAQAGADDFCPAARAETELPWERREALAAEAASIEAGKRERRVFIDVVHGGLETGFDDLLRSWGYQVESPPSGLQGGKESLFRSGVLLMSYKIGGGALGAEERALVQSYIDSGGSLLVLCPAWVWKAYDHLPLEQNPHHQLGKLYGLKLLDQSGGKPWTTRNLLVPDPPRPLEGDFAFSKIESPGADSMVLLADPEKNALGAAAIRGSSRLVLIGHNMLANPQSYRADPRLEEFTRDLLRWLVDAG